MSNKQLKSLKSWVKPKECMIHTLKQNIESLELALTHTKANIEGGWFITQQNKKVAEARTDYERKLEELNLAQLKSDLSNGLIGKTEELKIEELKIQLKIEEQGLKEIHNGIKKAGRNHNVKEVDGKCTYCRGKGCNKCSSKINTQVEGGNTNSQ